MNVCYGSLAKIRNLGLDIEARFTRKNIQLLQQFRLFINHKILQELLIQITYYH